MSDIREPSPATSPGPPKYTYVPALRVGNMVWLSGTTGTDDNGKITAPGDIVEQTRQIFRKFEKLLNSIGGTCDDIVETHDFFTTTENYKGTAAVRREFFKTSYPTSTGVLVSGLLRQDALIEISATAVLRGDQVRTPAARVLGGLRGRPAVSDYVANHHRGRPSAVLQAGRLRCPAVSRRGIRQDHSLRRPYLPEPPDNVFFDGHDGTLFTDTVLALVAVERGRFLEPVRPGDTIRTDVEVVEKKVSSDASRGIVVFRDHVINQREETVFQMDKITSAETAPGLIGPRWTTSSRQPLAAIEKVQNEKLRAMLDLCARGHPYYRRVWTEAGIDVGLIRTVADLEGFRSTQQVGVDGGPRKLPPRHTGPAPTRTRIVGDHLHHGQHRRPDADLQHDARLQRLPCSNRNESLASPTFAKRT